MKAFAWFALASVALSCGGSAFGTHDDSESGGSTSNDGGKAGTLGKAGRGSGGSVIGNGGKVGTGGGVSVGGFGIAGDLVTGGTLSTAGETNAGGAGIGPDPIDEKCPIAEPDGSKGCADGLRCSYGTDARASCRTEATCENGVWDVAQVDCLELEACPNIIQGNACGEAAEPCLIEGYIYCVCTGCSNAGPCSTDTVWTCAAGTGGQGCPHIAPNQGQACTGSAVCPYGSCATGEGVTASCNGTSWDWKFQACPK